MYKVEKQRHKVPESLRASKYPWDQMRVGDSFLVRDGEYRKISSATSMTNQRKAPRKWVARVVTDGVRVWRVE